MFFKSFFDITKMFTMFSVMMCDYGYGWKGVDGVSNFISHLRNDCPDFNNKFNTAIQKVLLVTNFQNFG